MTAIKAYAAYDAETPLKPLHFERKDIERNKCR
jgi:uncharacterized zinc-type alcohol dehydrogenase-like protein